MELKIGNGFSPCFFAQRKVFACLSYSYYRWHDKLNASCKKHAYVGIFM